MRARLVHCLIVALLVLAASFVCRCDEEGPFFEATRDPATEAYVEHLKAQGDSNWALYDRGADETESEIGAKLSEWGGALGQRQGVEVPTTNILAFRANADTPLVPETPLDNAVVGPRETVSMNETLRNLAIAVNVCPEDAQIHKRSEFEAGWNLLSGLGGISSQLLEYEGNGYGNPVLARRQMMETRDDSLALGEEIMQTAQEKGIGIGLLIAQPKCVATTIKLGYDLEELALSFALEISGVDVPTSALDAVGLLFPQLKPFTVLLSAVTYDSVPRVGQDELVEAAERLAGYVLSGPIERIIIDIEDTGERLANTIIGLPLAGTVPETAGAAGAAVLSLGIEARAGLGSVVGVTRSHADGLGHLTLSGYYSALVSGLLPTEPVGVDGPLQASFLSLLDMGALEFEVQNPSFVVRDLANLPPKVGLIQDQIYTAESGLSISLSADDPDGDMIRLRLGTFCLGELNITGKKPGRVEAVYSFSCDRECPDDFTVAVIAFDGTNVALEEFRVHKVNASPWGIPSYHLRIPLRFGEPMIYPLEPSWYEAGCLSFTDPDGDPLIFFISRPPRKGRAGLSNTRLEPGVYAVTIMYEIDRDEALLDHTGEEPFIDTFTVVATDPFGATAETVVEITVDVINSDPVCGNDEVTTPMNTAVEFEVLGNDSDIDGDELTVIAVGVAGNGMASSVAHNMIRYEPDNGFYGDDTFTYTVSDGYEGTDEATVTVHVVDAEPPVFVKGPGDVGPLSNIAGTCGAVGKWTAPVVDVDVTDNIGLASVTCTHASGDTFPVGVTTVTYTATDLSGNTTDHTFTVTVVDDELPTIDGMPSDICVEVPVGVTETVVSWIEPIARDNCGIASLVGTHTPGAVFPRGKTSVIYTATDIHGNTATDSLGVTVAEEWQLACQDKHVTTSNPSGTTVSFDEPVTGGCGVTTTFEPVSGSFFDVGDTDVLCAVTDGVRTETCTFTVTVEFVNHDPVANGDVVDLEDSEIAAEIEVLENDSDADGDELTVIDVSTSSPCGEVWIDADGKSVWFIGMYCQPYLGGTATFTYTVSDGNGGEDTATVSVDLPDTGTMPEVAEPPKDDR